jgi:hypothetical protein
LRLLENPLPGIEDYRRLQLRPDSVMPILGEHDRWYRPFMFEHPLYDRLASFRIAAKLGSRSHRRLLDPERLYRRGRFARSTEAMALHKAVFAAFADSVEASGARAKILFMPDRAAMKRTASGARPSYAPLLDKLHGRQLCAVDLADAFLAAEPMIDSIDEWFAPGGHYSPEANRVVAGWLAERYFAEPPSEGHAGC